MENHTVIETQSFSDDIRRYLLLLRVWAWLLILAAVLAGVSAYFVSKRITPVYQVATTLLINEAPSTKTADYASILTSERLARTYSEMLTKIPVLEAVIQELELSIEPKDLQTEINVELIRDTQLIEVKVDNTNPQTAADIANKLVTVFAEQTISLQATRYASSKQNLEGQLVRIDEQIQTTTKDLARLADTASNKPERDRLEAGLAQYRQTYASLLQSYEQVRVAEAASISNVVQVEPATLPTRPIRPRPLINSLLAGVAGLLLGVMAIFLIEVLDDTIRNPDEITRDLGLPVLGLVIRHSTDGDKPIAMLQPRSPVSESFRSLRTNLQFASVDHPLHSLLITSPSPSEGKTTIAANLGVVLSQGGRRVVLIDADLRRPRMHKIFNLPNRIGMSDLFVQPQIQLDGSLQKSSAEGLNVLTSGELPPNPAELLGSEKMSEILGQIKEHADIAVIDSPPVMAVTDSAVLAHRVDGVLLVIKPGFTKMAAARQAVNQLTRVGANLLGVVLNDVDFGHSRYGYAYYKGYYYSYHYYYDQSGKRIKKKVRSKSKSEKLIEPQEGKTDTSI